MMCARRCHESGHHSYRVKERRETEDVWECKECSTVVYTNGRRLGLESREPAFIPRVRVFEKGRLAQVY
jgi:hypothetical protein